ncbi:MAG: CoA transferase [Gammaproteobacteria bacterium]|jgi:crotonobetainyl-CoA:carnitine CoA-transferase CaiB-like acyl-CoA transferase|nr:CoA transferase [Gammaproteobacteria bacterium]MBP6050384.1 CoA transferase [Pseudomonadales bacterium]MBK6583697.1 CoA transferase [Gammaproteobacteria bacterium]MBK7170285.1 CoA transferase [Gammaproteobacteria bacterium]MBK7522036.1 CoA transferase [Gammaproteobacteria bacterium]
MAGLKPLEGLRVLELGQLLAGPFTGSLLAYFGAEVIKIEAPAGDPIRGWRELDENGTSYWWRSLGRNKKCITIDLGTPEGRALALRLANRSDVLIENFSPGVMERWGLAPADLKKRNPRLVYARISGYGQDGPYASRPGFASVCEGISGFRYVNGYPGEAPVRPNLSIGDTIAALHAALGIMLALRARDALPDTGGQVVDVALYESMFNLMEAVVPEFSGAGVVREPSGTTVTGIVPTNTYRCADGRHVVIGGNGDSIFRRLMEGIGRADLGTDPGLAHNAGRVAREAEIDAVIGEWCAGRPVAVVLSVMERQRVPAGPIYSVREMFEDPHFRARQLFERVEIDGKTLEIPALFPRLADTPGATEWAGAGIGSHTDEVLREVLGLDGGEIAALRDAAVI